MGKKMLFNNSLVYFSQKKILVIMKEKMKEKYILIYNKKKDKCLFTINNKVLNGKI